jgi:hypothetical protein
MKRAAIALALLASTAAAAAQPTAIARFPEMPALEPLVPTARWTFEQETWTAHNRQHCWEWGFPETSRPHLEQTLRAAVRSIGWDDTILDRGTLRRDGGVVAIAPGFRLDHLDPRTALLKISVCTEGLGSENVRLAFIANVSRDPFWPTPPLGTPDVVWRRRYADARHAIGIAYRGIDHASARRRLEAEGYAEIAREPVVELRRGHARARFMADLWWQREDIPPLP